MTYGTAIEQERLEVDYPDVDHDPYRDRNHVGRECCRVRHSEPLSCSRGRLFCFSVSGGRLWRFLLFLEDVERGARQHGVVVAPIAGDLLA